MMSERSASRRLLRTLAMPRASTAADCGSKLLVLSLICTRANQKSKWALTASSQPGVQGVDPALHSSAARWSGT
jgi:hypothetical protein